MGDFVQQFNLFNFDKEKKTITKPIRLIELFSGIGAQAKALEILGVPFEHWKTCEWAVNSIKSYNAIHIKDFTDYSKELTKEQLIEYLDGNISTNYNEPCNVKRQSEKWLRDVYNNCIATHNLMNIMKVKGSDLEIVDVDKYEYILTYSFPCQDLSLAGQRKGMATSQADGGTRSGLLWECERILDELEEKPQILLMENVPEVIGAGNVEHFNKWLAKLESLGYQNYFEILNAKNYCIPQNRRRCFMISLLGDYAYDFPLKIKAKYCLKDFLEKDVPEKYFLDTKDIERISSWKAYEKPLENVLDVENGDDEISTLTTHVGKDSAGMKLVGFPKYSEKSLERIAKNIVEDDNSPCITANAMQSVNHQNCVLIKENNNDGYKAAEDGDGINIASRMEHQRGNVQKGSIQTLKTQMEIGVVVDGNYGNGHHAKNVYNDKGIAPTITTGNHGLGTVINTNENDVKLVGGFGNKCNSDRQFHEQNRVYDGECLATSIPANSTFSPYYTHNLRIRKLVPCETLKLMGFEKCDYQAMLDAGMCDSAIYHCAGDSIVVTCLMGLIGTMVKNDKELQQLISGYAKSIVEN